MSSGQNQRIKTRRYILAASGLAIAGCILLLNAIHTQLRRETASVKARSIAMEKEAARADAKRAEAQKKTTDRKSVD